MQVSIGLSERFEPAVTRGAESASGGGFTGLLGVATGRRYLGTPSLMGAPVDYPLGFNVWRLERSSILGAPEEKL